MNDKGWKITPTWSEFNKVIKYSELDYVAR